MFAPQNQVEEHCNNEIKFIIKIKKEKRINRLHVGDVCVCVCAKVEVIK